MSEEERFANRVEILYSYEKSKLIELYLKEEQKCKVCRTELAIQKRFPRQLQNRILDLQMQIRRLQRDKNNLVKALRDLRDPVTNRRAMPDLSYLDESLNSNTFYGISLTGDE